MTNQDPYSMNGTNAMGRWDYGPWFWPPFTGLQYGPVTNPYAASDPNLEPLIPDTQSSECPSLSWTHRFVNGMAYPTLTVEPKAYRFRILNRANDRYLNLQLYTPATGIVGSITFTPGSGYTAYADSHHHERRGPILPATARRYRHR